MSAVFTLTSDGYEKIETAISQLEQVARKAVLDEQHHKDHTREALSKVYQVRQVLRDVILVEEGTGSEPA